MCYATREVSVQRILTSIDSSPFSLRGAVVEKLCEYLAYKSLYGQASAKEEIPDFGERIAPEIALEL